MAVNQISWQLTKRLVNALLVPTLLAISRPYYVCFNDSAYINGWLDYFVLCCIVHTVCVALVNDILIFLLPRTGVLLAK